MSGEKKPAITRAGKKSETIAVEKTRAQKRKEAKDLKAKKKALKKQTAEAERKKKLVEIRRRRELKKQKGKSTKKTGAKRTKQKVSKSKKTQPNRQFKVRYVATFAVLGLAVIGYALYSSGDSSQTLGEAATTGLLSTSIEQEAAGTGEKPSEFAALLPVGISSDAYQFDQNIGVFFFRHELDGRLIVANQQMMPAEIALSENGIKNLVLSKEGATSITQLSTDKGPVYLATLDSGREVAIFGYRDLLIFIEASSTIEPEIWFEYINSLQ